MLATLGLRAMRDDERHRATYILGITGRELLMVPDGFLGN